MIKIIKTFISYCGHRSMVVVLLCLFGLCISLALPNKIHHKRREVKSDRIELLHADQLSYDMYGANPNAQILKGRVSFRHAGATLTCDSAYFYQADNSMKAFGHVRFRQGDTLSLFADRAEYDGQEQVMHARKNVVLKHRRQVLHTDSLDYDRLYKTANFFEGGTLVDGRDRLVADWGEYNTDTRQATFFFHVRLKGKGRMITTDTLYYDTKRSIAHVVGPSKIRTKQSITRTKNAYFDTRTDRAQLYGRSTIIDGHKTITGDTLLYNSKRGNSRGYGNVIFVDKKNKNMLRGNYLLYNERGGYGFATRKALLVDFSQKDTLYMHADTLKLFTFHINTDSVYRKVRAYHKVRVYRKDMQAVCDSLVGNSKDSSMVMYKDPVVWNNNRQLLGECIKLYMNDSTIREAHVYGQALSVEKAGGDDGYYNQLSSKEMHAYFANGEIKRVVAVGNVLSVFYPQDDKDSSLVMMNYIETDTMKMYFAHRRELDKIWTPKAVGTSYPLTQIPADKLKLPSFAWHDEIRPRNKDDVFTWKGKSKDTELKYRPRIEAPLQHLQNTKKSKP